VNFRFGRRTGVYRSLNNLSKPEYHRQVEKALRRIESDKPGGIEKALSDLMESFICSYRYKIGRCVCFQNFIMRSFSIFYGELSISPKVTL
jgi:hypothetical protein